MIMALEGYFAIVDNTNGRPYLRKSWLTKREAEFALRDLLKCHPPGNAWHRRLVIIQTDKELKQRKYVEHIEKPSREFRIKSRYGRPRKLKYLGHEYEKNLKMGANRFGRSGS